MSSLSATFGGPGRSSVGSPQILQDYLLFHSSPMCSSYYAVLLVIVYDSVSACFALWWIVNGGKVRKCCSLGFMSGLMSYFESDLWPDFGPEIKI